MMKPDSVMTCPRWDATAGSRAATAETSPCDATGPSAVELAEAKRLPHRVVSAMRARAQVGREKYGTELRSPWRPGTREAWQEILDAIGYLLVTEDADDEVFAHRLAGQADAWARKRGLYTGLHDG